jgi:hypothetical protein
MEGGETTETLRQSAFATAVADEAQHDTNRAVRRLPRPEKDSG